MRTFFLSLLVLTTSAFSQPTTKPTLLKTDSKFSDSGTVELVESPVLRGTEVDAVESGVLNGIHYKFYYTDGSGTFAGRQGDVGGIMEPTNSNWTVECSKDAITDRKMCRMRMRDLWIYVYPGGRATLSVGAEHFPGTTVTVRIDQTTPTTTDAKRDGDFDFQTSARILSRLKNGTTLTTRYMRWPYRTWEDHTWELYGFEEALMYIRWAVQRIK